MPNQRSYCVKIYKCLSNVFVSSSGVPQGSNIGPVLFILFINDVVFALSNQCLLMYADDIKIYATIRNNSDSSTLQHSLDKFSNWCSANSLSLCVYKCCVISLPRKKDPIKRDYNLDSCIIPRNIENKDLGTIINLYLYVPI